MFHYLDQSAIDIVVINDSQEGMTIRSILESFGCIVRVHFVGNIQHFLSLFKDPNFLHPFLILSCHGNAEGLLLPELSPEIESQMPIHHVLTPKDVQTNLQFNQQIILNTGCCLGSKDFAETFIRQGAKAYIGVKNYIEGSAVISFITFFFYLHFVKKLPIEEAFHPAKNIDLETQQFQLLLASI